MGETKGAGSEKALEEPATRKDTTAGETKGVAPDEMLKGAAKRGPTAEEIVEPVIMRLAAKGVEKTAVLGDVPTHTT